MSLKRNLAALAIGVSLLGIRGHEHAPTPPAPDPHAALSPLDSASDKAARDAFFNDLSSLIDHAKDAAMDKKGTLLFLATLNRLEPDINANEGSQSFRLNNKKSGETILDFTAEFASVAETYRKLPPGAVPKEYELKEFIQRKVKQAAGPDMYDMIPKQAIDNVVGDVVYSLSSTRAPLQIAEAPATAPATGTEPERGALMGQMAKWVSKMADQAKTQQGTEGPKR